MTSKNASKVTVQVIVSKCNFKDMLCKLPLQNFKLPVNKAEKKNEWEEEIIDTKISNTVIWNRVIWLNMDR